MSVTATNHAFDSQDIWLSSRKLAELAICTDRAARKAAELAMRGKMWRGVSLTVRKQKGVGGARGTLYEFLLDSLPIDLQTRYWQQRQARVNNPQVAPQINMQSWTPEERDLRHEEFAKLPDSMQQEAKRRMLLVAQFHDMTGSKMHRYKSLARETGESVTTLRRWVSRCNRHDRADWIVLLAPRYKRERDRADFCQEAQDFVQRNYFIQTRPALKPIYRKLLAAAAVEGWSVPSYDSILRWVQSFPRTYVIFTRHGGKALDRSIPAVERDYSTLGLHDLWESDGRKADLFAVFPDGDIRRPHVVAWREVRTRKVLGYAVGKVESADLILRAFRAACLNAGRALPQEALLDNGRGFASKAMTGHQPTRYRFKVRETDPHGVLSVLGIKVRWSTPGRGQVKPIESGWRFLAEYVDKCFPGAYCGNRPDMKPEDFNQHNAIPLTQYLKKLDEAFAQFNSTSHRGNSMFGRSPDVLFQTLSGTTPVRQATARQLDSCLLAVESVKLQKLDHALILMGNRYWCQRLSDLNSRGPYTVRFNPDDATQPVLLYDGDRFIAEVPLLAKTGFQDMNSANEHLRAKSRAMKFTRQAAAEQEKAIAARLWKAPERSRTSAIASIDRHTSSQSVVKMVRPPMELPPIPTVQRQSINGQELEQLIENGMRAQKGVA